MRAELDRLERELARGARARRHNRSPAHTNTTGSHGFPYGDSLSPLRSGGSLSRLEDMPSTGTSALATPREGVMPMEKVSRRPSISGRVKTASQTSAAGVPVPRMSAMGVPVPGTAVEVRGAGRSSASLRAITGEGWRAKRSSAKQASGQGAGAVEGPGSASAALEGEGSRLIPWGEAQSADQQVMRSVSACARATASAAYADTLPAAKFATAAVKATVSPDLSSATTATAERSPALRQSSLLASPEPSRVASMVPRAPSTGPSVPSVGPNVPSMHNVQAATGGSAEGLPIGVPAGAGGLARTRGEAGRVDIFADPQIVFPDRPNTADSALGG